MFYAERFNPFCPTLFEDVYSRLIEVIYNGIPVMYGSMEPVAVYAIDKSSHEPLSGFVRSGLLLSICCLPP
jgi:hypothetical protein